jgi:DNA polymerase-4
VSSADPPPLHILHVDLDAFYASVEVLRDPGLAGRPVLVGGTGPRGVVAAASYEARRFGIHSAMPMARARRLCPQAVVLPPRFDAYGEASAAVMDLLRAFTPLVEPLALDEAFLDVSGSRRLFGAAPQVGAAIRTRIRAKTGLTASVGIGTTKLMAKLASEEAKPDGLLVIEPGTELDLLHPLPVGRLWGVGPATAQRLGRFGVATVGDLAALPVETVVGALGQAAGTGLHALAWNRDERRVEPDREIKSIGQEETFPRDVHALEPLRQEARRMAERVGNRLRDKGLAGRTVTLKVRYHDFRTITRSATVPEPVSASPDITRLALALLEKVDLGGGVRLLGVSVRSLTAAPAHQEALPLDETAGEDAPPRSEDMQRAVDAVRARFGDDAVGPAALLEP